MTTCFHIHAFDAQAYVEDWPDIEQDLGDFWASTPLSGAVAGTYRPVELCSAP